VGDQVESAESVTNSTPVELPRGRFNGRLDDKGRLKLPSAFAQFFHSLPENRMFLTSLDRHIATLYPISEWRVNEKFFNSFTANPAAAKNILFNAQDLGGDVEMDNQNRVVFHPELRRELGMEGTDLHLMAAKGHVDILTEAQYQARKRQATENTVNDLDVLERAGLR
jgi:MraZ protein